MSEFAERLLAWHRQHGRHDLPWQGTREPYRVWLAEIMLQQTQVATVIPYYQRFLARLPTLAALAAAPAAEVMALWSGLGYYARARHLHRCAQQVLGAHGGEFPHTAAALATLPGIGRSTANSIASVCFGACAPVLDGNVKRVLCRAFAIEGVPGAGAVEKRLWQLAEALMPAHDAATYNQAQMDLGALVCTRARAHCAACPLATICLARQQGRVDELPQRRPGRPSALRHARLLVAIDESGRVLLEQRPPAGIWGGLLSLPELPEGVEAADYIAREIGTLQGAASPAPSFVHVFSHFRLQIAPWLCHVRPRPVLRESGQHWLTAQEWAAAALPAPVRRLLQGLPGRAPPPGR